MQKISKGAPRLVGDFQVKGQLRHPSPPPPAQFKVCIRALPLLPSSPPSHQTRSFPLCSCVRPLSVRSPLPLAFQVPARVTAPESSAVRGHLCSGL